MQINVNTPEADKQIYLCGNNSEGIFANGNTTNQSSPILFDTKQFGVFNHIKKLVFSGSSTTNLSGISVNWNASAYIVLSTNITSPDMGKDKIYVWGQNNNGQLGIGNTNNQPTPVLFDTTQFGTYKNIKEFSLDWTSYAIIDFDGNNEKLFSWGSNNYGQLGIGNMLPLGTSTPKQLSSSIFNNSKIKSITLSEQSNMFMILTKNGIDELYTWGRNDANTVGNGTIVNQFVPYRIPQSSLGGATEIISAKSSFLTSFAQVRILGALRVYVWGYNAVGVAGDGTINNIRTPAIFPNSRLGNYIEIYDSSFDPKYFGSSMFAYVKTTVGDRIYTWGNNPHGQLGTGNSAATSTPFNTNIGLSTAKKVNFNTLNNTFMINIIDQNNSSRTIGVGLNTSGQLGVGNTTNTSSFTPILPTRYTNPQSKITPTPNLTSSQALELINPNNNLVRTELDKYVDTTSFPAGATLSIDPATTTSDYKNGILNLGIRTNQYNDLLIVNTVTQPKTFNVTIPGFRPVTDVNTNPVSVIIRDADGNNIDKIYDQLVDSTYKVINRDLLEYYFDLSSIPPNAVIHLYRTSFGNDTEATFTLTSSQVYGNNGLIVSNQLYVKTDLVWTFTSSQLNLALVISLSVVGGLLLIGAIIAIMLVRRSSNRLII